VETAGWADHKDRVRESPSPKLEENKRNHLGSGRRGAPSTTTTKKAWNCFSREKNNKTPPSFVVFLCYNCTQRDCQQVYSAKTCSFLSLSKSKQGKTKTTTKKPRHHRGHAFRAPVVASITVVVIPSTAPPMAPSNHPSGIPILSSSGGPAACRYDGGQGAANTMSRSRWSRKRSDGRCKIASKWRYV